MTDNIHEFARELAHYLHRHRLEAVAPKGTILWEDYDEFSATLEESLAVIEVDGGCSREFTPSRLPRNGCALPIEGDKIVEYCAGMGLSAN